MFRARNRFEIPLADIRTDDGTPLDLSRVRSMQFEFHSAEKFERDLWLYNLYIAAAEQPTRARSELLLDFGPQGAPLLDGSRPIDEHTAYAKWRGYGWTTNMEKATSAEFNQPKPDPMLNSMVWADLGARKATLRVDLPDGVYRARFWGGNYTSKAVAARAFRARRQWRGGGGAAGRPGHFLYRSRIFSRYRRLVPARRGYLGKVRRAISTSIMIFRLPCAAARRSLRGRRRWLPLAC